MYAIPIIVIDVESVCCELRPISSDLLLRPIVSFEDLILVVEAEVNVIQKFALRWLFNALVYQIGRQFRYRPDSMVVGQREEVEIDTYHFLYCLV